MKRIDKKNSFFVGPRNCGKSECAEKMLEKYDNRLYFGTIKDCFENKDIIKRHFDRRDDRWIVLETCGDIVLDINEIAKIINTFGGEGACLIDGLTTWVYSVTRELNNVLMNSRILSSLIVDIVNTYTSIVWVFVDVLPDQYSEGEVIYSYAANTIHSNILNRIGNINIFKYK